MASQKILSISGRRRTYVPISSLRFNHFILREDVAVSLLVLSFVVFDSVLGIVIILPHASPGSSSTFTAMRKINDLLIGSLRDRHQFVN